MRGIRISGGGLNNDDGLLYLDATVRVDTTKEALYIAEAGDQEGIFNFNTYEETRSKDGIKAIDGIEALEKSGAYDNRAADVARRNTEKLDSLFREAGLEGSTVTAQAVTAETVTAIPPYG